jgi:hypothetical protein
LRPLAFDRISGRDVLGSFTGYRMTWSPPEFQTSVRIYDDDDIVVFKQQFLCPVIRGQCYENNFQPF